MKDDSELQMDDADDSTTYSPSEDESDLATLNPCAFYSELSSS
jgi:hypothetical protein